MAATKSLVSLSSRAMFVSVLIALVVQTQVAQPQAQTCSSQIANLNVCTPFVLPSAANTRPSQDCCNALQAMDHDCLCNTMRITARIPSQCNLPPVSCAAN